MKNPHPAKHWWQSKTIIGAVAVLVAALFKKLGVDPESVTSLIAEGTVFAGAVLAILGRAGARGDIRNPITGKAKPRTIEVEVSNVMIERHDVEA